MRAVLDPIVLISAVLSRSGVPARILGAWGRGAFELIVSDQLLAELERALAYPRLAELISPGDAAALLDLLRDEAELVADPREPPPLRSDDPGDDYLIALSAAQRAPLVSGDKHLLRLAADLPILSPREFIELLPDVPPKSPHS